MAGYAAAMAVTLQYLQFVLFTLESYLAMGGRYCPTSSSISTIINISSFDYIVVGAGEAGSVVTFRLDETNATVLVLEAGVCPPMESYLPGLFTTLPLSDYDYAMNIHNDGYACQNLKSDGGATIGKMLGGSSAISHMIYVTPTEGDYSTWSTAANDSSWSYDYLINYFAKGEHVMDEGVLAQNTSLHGTSGPTLLKRQESSFVAPIIAGYEELGLTYKNDSYGPCTNQPLLTIGDNLRQSGTVSYLRYIKSSNIYFLTGAVVEKVLFDNTKATGVQFTYNGTTYTANATNKVILTTGALITPQLLMLSGVGDSAALSELNITTVVNNTHVGKYLMDHPTVVYCTGFNKSTATGYSDKNQFPVPMMTAYAAAPGATTVTEQDIVLYFTTASSGFLQLCTYGFKYKDAICDAWYEYNKSKDIAMTVANYMFSSSNGTGSVTLNTTSITDQPIIKLNLFNDTDVLDEFATLLQSSAEIINTTAYKNLSAEYVDPGVCSDYTLFSTSYWKCYALAMTSTMWHYSGTCMLGKVVDANFTVIGTSNLMAVGPCVFPTLVTGNIASAVRAIAEKAADVIKTVDELV